MNRVRTLPRAQRRWRRRARAFTATVHRGRGERSESGFTLLELIIVVTILPLIVGAIAVALIATFQLQSSVSDRLTASGDAQVVSANYFHDIQSASFVTTNATPGTPAQCVTPGATAILGLEWSLTAATVNSVAPVSPGTVVSYEEIPNGVRVQGVEQNNLVRNECSFTGSSTVTVVSSSVVSHNVPSGLTAGISGLSCGFVSCSSTSPWSLGWAPGAGITDIRIAVDESSTKVRSSASASCSTALANTYCYTVVALPRQWTELTPCPPGSGRVDCPVTAPNLTPPLLLLGGGGSSSLSGNACNVTVNGAIVLNQTSNGGINLGGNTTVVGSTIITADRTSSGTSVLSGSSSVTPAPITGPTATDPFLGQSLPTLYFVPATPPTNPAPTTSGGHGSRAVITYSPGIYTTTLSIGSNTNTVFAPGVYEFQAGVSLGGGGTISSETVGSLSGVLFYVTGGSVTLGGTGVINLSPYEIGNQSPYGALTPTIWQDSSDHNPITLGGNSGATTIFGTIYAPSTTVIATGHGTVSAGQVMAQGVSCGSGPITIGVVP